MGRDSTGGSVRPLRIKARPLAGHALPWRATAAALQFQHGWRLGTCKRCAHCATTIRAAQTKIAVQKLETITVQTFTANAKNYVLRLELAENFEESAPFSQLTYASIALQLLAPAGEKGTSLVSVIRRCMICSDRKQLAEGLKCMEQLGVGRAHISEQIY